jgi:hypothetical protein
MIERAEVAPQKTVDRGDGVKVEIPGQFEHRRTRSDPGHASQTQTRCALDESASFAR